MLRNWKAVMEAMEVVGEKLNGYAWGADSGERAVVVCAPTREVLEYWLASKFPGHKRDKVVPVTIFLRREEAPATQGELGMGATKV